MTPAIVVIDGEHYPPVVRDAIAGLPYEVIGAWLAGGTEKLRGEPDYGVPLVEALEDGFTDAEVVVDLSDEPVFGAARTHADRQPCPCSGSSLRRRRLSLRAAAVRAVSTPVAGSHRYRETRRQDGRDGSCRAPARTGS